MYYFYVALFGALGAAARYGASNIPGADSFPFNTLFINIAGCFFLAFTVKYLTTLPNLSKNLVNGIGTGFIGSFTTFSTFSAEVAQMILRGDYFPASCYVFASIFGGFLSAQLGFYLSDRIILRKGLNENGR